MNGHILVALLKSVVFAYIVQVVTPDDNGPLHLHLHNNATEDATSDAHIAGEWALLIDVRAFDGLVENRWLKHNFRISVIC